MAYTKTAWVNGGAPAISAANLGKIESALENSVGLDTLADLRALAVPTSIFSARILGHSAVGDGGGGLFWWDSASSDADNNGTIIIPNSTPANGRWKRVVGNIIDVKLFGAVNDGIADSGPAIQAANDWIEQQGRVGGILLFSKGTYKSFQKLRVGGWVTWRGEGAFSTSLSFDSALLDNLIELGPDQSGAFSYSGSYVFGARIEDMDINAGDVYRGLDKAVIFTNGAHQDSGIARCQIRNFRSIGVNINDGIGAPASFHIEDVNFQSAGAPDVGNKIGIRSNAGGCQLNLRRLQIETDGTNPFLSAVSMVKDHLIAENIHVEGATNGITLSQNESTIRTAVILGVTGKSDVQNLVNVGLSTNVEYTLQSVNNTTLTATNINALLDNKSGTTIGGTGGASIANYSNVRRIGGNNLAHATLNYSHTSAAIQGGFGISSVVRNGVGDFTVTYTKAAKTTNVVAIPAARLSLSAPGFAVATPSSTTQIGIRIYDAAGVATDPDRFHLAVFDAE